MPDAVVFADQRDAGYILAMLQQCLVDLDRLEMGVVGAQLSLVIETLCAELLVTDKRPSASRPRATG